MANLNIGQEVPNIRDKIGIAAHNVAKRYFYNCLNVSLQFSY